MRRPTFCKKNLTRCWPTACRTVCIGVQVKSVPHGFCIVYIQLLDGVIHRPSFTASRTVSGPKSTAVDDLGRTVRLLDALIPCCCKIFTTALCCGLRQHSISVLLAQKMQDKIIEIEAEALDQCGCM